MVVVGRIAKVKAMVGACICRLEFIRISFSNMELIKQTQLTFATCIIAHHLVGASFIIALLISCFIYFIKIIFYNNSNPPKALIAYTIEI